MSRFILIVIVLVVLALVVNNWMKSNQQAPAAADTGSSAENAALPSGASAQHVPDVDVPPLKLSPPANATTVGAETTEIEATEFETTQTDAEEPAQDEIVQDTPESRDEILAGTASTAPQVVAVVDPEQAGDADRQEGVDSAEVEENLPGEEEVLLGTDELTGGIPGEGPLTLDEVRSWLDDPRNHMVIKPQLPKGLAAGASQIAGIDENPLTRAKIEVGRQLYFDTRISIDNSISCASCHDPDQGYAKETQFGVGVAGQEGNRNSPVAYNRILSTAQFWDGRAASLEDQAIGPMANPIEMGNTHEVVTETLNENPIYKLQFEKIFPDGVTIENAGKAIASFERVIVTGPAPWDYYVELRDFENAFAADLEDLEFLEDDDPELYEEYMALQAASEAHPIDEAARRGGELFFSDKTGCTACHVGANFTDEKYHNLGVGMNAEEPDLGRFAVTNEDADRGTFKTPTVRNVALTAPYMHDGSVETLEEVVELYVKGGEANPHLSEKVKKLELNDQEKADLVAFMRSLQGDFPPVERGRLPE